MTTQTTQIKTFNPEVLIPRNEMGGRIQILRADRSKEQSQIGTSKNEPLRPNCHGTSVYLFGLNKRVKQLWQDFGYKLNDFSSPKGDFVCIPDDSSPGYVGERPMKLLLEEMEETSMIPGCLVAYNYGSILSPFNYGLNHSATYLGIDKPTGKHKIFHQHGHGGPWEFANLNFLEEELSPEGRSGLRIKFFRLRR